MRAWLLSAALAAPAAHAASTVDVLMTARTAEFGVIDARASFEAIGVGQGVAVSDLTPFVLGATLFSAANVTALTGYLLGGQLVVGGAVDGADGAGVDADDWLLYWVTPGATPLGDAIVGAAPLSLLRAEYRLAGDMGVAPLTVLEWSVSFANLTGDACAFGGCRVVPVDPGDDGAGAPVGPGDGVAPIPLPAAGWLLMAALGGLAVIRRRG